MSTRPNQHRRGHFELICEVLIALRQRDLSLTHVMMATTSNSNVAAEILEYLESKGFVMHSTTQVKSRTYHMYHLTRFGWDLSDHYARLKHALQ